MIRFLDLGAYRRPEGDRVIHVKGFASRLDFAGDRETARAAAALVEAARATRATVVAWDGDAYAADSFSKVLLDCADALGARLLAFKFRAGREAFEASWAPTARPITCVLVDDLPDPTPEDADAYAYLGVQGLRATGATEAFCLGGGPTTEGEVQGAPQSATFRLFACGRRSRHAGGPVERPSLEGAVAYKNLVHEDLTRWLVAAAAAEPAAATVCYVDETSTALRHYAHLAAGGDGGVVCDDGLRVAPSLIAGAGMGLFTTHRRRSGDVVAEYVGSPMPTAVAIRLADKSYLMRLAPQRYIDASPHLYVKARYVNDSRSARTRNVEFLKRPDDQKALVRCTRDLDAGDELYVDYGRMYWAAHDLQAVASSNGAPPLKQAR